MSEHDKRLKQAVKVILPSAEYQAVLIEQMTVDQLKEAVGVILEDATQKEGIHRATSERLTERLNNAQSVIRELRGSFDKMTNDYASLIRSSEQREQLLRDQDALLIQLQRMMVRRVWALGICRWMGHQMFGPAEFRFCRICNTPEKLLMVAHGTD